MTSTMAATQGSTSTTSRGTWALWGSAAGLCGILTNMVFAQGPDEKVRAAGDPAAVVDLLSRTNAHISANTGYLAVVCLLFFAAGLARWGSAQASDSLALRVAPMGLVASAGALIASYGVKGQLAAYLEGGFNESSANVANRYFFFLLDDLAGYFSWFGVTITAGCLAWLAFRERLVVRWVGAVGALVVIAVALNLVAFGFTGFSGVVAPVFLLLAGIGLSRQRT